MSPIICSVTNPLLTASLHADGRLSLRHGDRTWRTHAVAVQDRGEVEEDTVWLRTERSSMETWPGRFRVQATAETNGAEITVLGLIDRPLGTFHVRLGIVDGALSVQVSDLHPALPSLCWPPPFISDASLIPTGAGRLHRTDRPTFFDRQLYIPHTTLNMRCFAALDDDGEGLLAWFPTEVADFAVLVVNGAAAPVWLRSLGQWQGAREVRFRPTSNGYVGAAKAYRRELQAMGWFRTLAEKQTSHPTIGRLVGGRVLTYFQAWPASRPEVYDSLLFHPKARSHLRPTYTVDFTHAKVQASLAHARQQGFSNGLVLLRGWMTGGYDSTHPDILPPDPRLGTLDEFRALLAGDARTIVSLHDEYQSIYEGGPSYPRGLIRGRDGEVIRGSIWAGGQAFIHHSKVSLERAQHNWNQLIALGARSIHCDTTAASRIKQSFDPELPETKAEDIAGKRALLGWFVSQGLAVGSEEGCDLAADRCHWFETRHGRLGNRHTVPFWQLVFHDCCFTSRLTSFSPGRSYPGWLEDLLWGNLIHVFMDPRFGGIGGVPSDPTGFGANPFDEAAWHASQVVDRLHARIGTSEMLDHRFLDADGEVEQVTWAGGIRVTVNFSSRAYTDAEGIIPGHGHRITG